MKIIEETALKSGRWPEGWFEEWRRGKFAGGAFDNGGIAVLHVPLPEENFETLAFELEIEADAAGQIACSDGVAAILVDGERGRHVINFAGIGTLAIERGESSPS